MSARVRPASRRHQIVMPGAEIHNVVARFRFEFACRFMLTSIIEPLTSNPPADRFVANVS
ncbi:MAG: hypothetical protein DME77_09130 [Verrucomicrobia bacterium]|nr:MAG: hypothetical protein DME77_09130 [Verrucomicrobiota bacterium]